MAKRGRKKGSGKTALDKKKFVSPNVDTIRGDGKGSIACVKSKDIEYTGKKAHERKTMKKVFAPTKVNAGEFKTFMEAPPNSIFGIKI